MFDTNKASLTLSFFLSTCGLQLTFTHLVFTGKADVKKAHAGVKL